MEEIKRILVIGCCGTGKSTFSKKIGILKNIKVYHLDKLYHSSGWTPKPKEEWIKIVKELSSKDKWIMDGNYSGTLKLRAERAQQIYFFDFPSLFCTMRVVRRAFKSKLGIEKRVDLPENCHERWFDWEFVKYTYNFNRDNLPRIMKILEGMKFDKNKITMFNKTKQSNEYLNKLKLNLEHSN